jgi:hypothetical protein
MKNPTRRSLSLLVLLALVSAARCPAITPSEWQHRQALIVTAPGLVRVDLTPASFEAAGPQQEDFRILDPKGKETALIVDRPPVPVARAIRPSSFQVRVPQGLTEITVTTGTSEKLSVLFLETPSPFFLRAVKIEISENESEWTTLDQNVPIFRESGAEKLSLSIGGHKAAFIRITVADNHDAPLPFTGALLVVEASAPPEPLAVGAHISSHDEFAGETVLTIALDGRNLPLASLVFETKEPIFMRRVAISVREVRDAIPTERTIGTGTLFRVALAGAPPREQLELPLVFSPTTRELLVHIYNGDSPPLSIDTVRLNRWPVSLLFMAPEAGSYALLSGNPQALAPRYDLAAFAGEMRGGSATTVTPGAVEDTPDYHPSESLGSPLPDVPLSGAPLDAAPWSFRRPVLVSQPGVQELELDLDALAKTRPDYADIRLLRDGNQIPYVLEQPGLARSLVLKPEASLDPNRPSLSIWKVQLPKEGLPLKSIVLTSATSLFQREFRVFEKSSSQEEGPGDYMLASGQWSRRPEPGAAETHVFELPARVSTNTLWIETDNGDNPAIALGTVQIVYPVVRLVFKVAGIDGLTLAYGNETAIAPRYDLGLVAARLLTSNRNAAHLGLDELGKGSNNPFTGMNGGYIFWGALAVAVVVLLIVVAKLLPKPLAPRS